MLAASLALAPSAAFPWEMDQFLVLLGWPTEVQCPDDEALARVMSHAGINTVMWDLRRLELCRKYGLRLAVPHGAAVTEDLDDPAVWGYHILHEPDERQFPFCAEVVAKLHQADPGRPAHVSVRADGGDLLRRFLEVVRPRILSYAHYQWWWGQQARHFPLLEDHRHASLDAGIPLVRWVEVNAAEGDSGGSSPLPQDNAVKLRQSVYTSLPYGIKGVEWFTAEKLFRHAAAELRPCGEDVAALNAELKRLGPVLVRLRSRDVFHTAPVPAACRPVPGGLGVATDTPDLVIGILEHPDDGRSDYLLVANKSIRESRHVRLRFGRRPSGARRLSKRSGRWAPLRVRRADEAGVLELSLAPGDGELLRVRPRTITLKPSTRPGERIADAPPLVLDDEPPLLLDDGPQRPGQEMADNSRCHHCHLNYVQEQLAVVHARANMGCAHCHGASDEHIADESWASGGNGTAPDTMYRREQVNPFCLSCHAKDTLPEPEHGAFLAGAADKRHCTDCHGEHRLAVRRCKWK
jgi:hypothetical protein